MFRSERHWNRLTRCRYEKSGTKYYIAKVQIYATLLTVFWEMQFIFIQIFVIMRHVMNLFLCLNKTGDFLGPA